jgi:hypothetical protein
MESGELERLLTDLRDIADRRAASDPGSTERADLDDALRVVQDRILRWPAEDVADEPTS